MTKAPVIVVITDLIGFSKLGENDPLAAVTKLNVAMEKSLFPLVPAPVKAAALAAFRSPPVTTSV